jgi:hypothetical protein
MRKRCDLRNCEILAPSNNNLQEYAGQREAHGEEKLLNKDIFSRRWEEECYRDRRQG